MDNTQDTKPGPDLSLGVAVSDIPASGLLKGQVGDDGVLLARVGGAYFAVGSSCTHYGGPLAEGLLDGHTVRCPWHHACFSLRTGEALHAPAIDPLACWNVEQRGDKIFVTGKTKALPVRKPISGQAPSRVVIVGGGAAGFAAAEQLRREGYEGSLVMLSDDADPPVDRPNLSKDYLAGVAQEEWVPLRAQDWYRDNAIELRLNTKVSKIDARAREVELADGTRIPYERLLLATGAEPVRLDIPGGNLAHVHVLRTLKDCRAIIAAAERVRRVVVIGASFIGLETAAALRTRNLDVHVVAPEKRPLERVFGAELGDFVRSLHEEKGVVFHMENTVTAIEPNKVSLKNGHTLDADLVVMGVGVRPRTELAEQAGLTLDRGVVVNEYLETSAAGIFAAGDIARWPDRHSGENIRVEHWVVAERQGQAAARAMLGHGERYDGVPFFWSQHYDVPINYVGHAEKWDEIAIDGNIPGKDCILRFKRNGRVLAAASIFRDVASLQTEVMMERAAAV
jgi:NADPH-dependent 2,4-dienoyl-CoA reductase/sulfur reductase-like enzyme/nitrite reductase/ring-hydroxylating ferredoxin subunit